MIALLAGPSQLSPEGQQVKQEIAERIRTVMDDQRLLSLDTLFALGDGLNQMAQGKPAPENLLAQARRNFANSKCRGPSSPPPNGANGPPGLYNTSHATLQMRTDLAKVIKGPGSPAELAEARGQLAPLLRDTLVGLNYAYYEPPSAQALHNNPLLVRSHDFSGEMTPGAQQAWQSPARLRPRLDGQRRRASYRLARRFALRAGANGAGFHRAGKCAGAHLGRDWSRA